MSLFAEAFLFWKKGRLIRYKYCNACALFHAFAGFEPFLAGCFLLEGVKIQRVDYSLSLHLFRML
jgi:hypothetical protein